MSKRMNPNPLDVHNFSCNGYQKKLPADARPELLGSMQSVLQDKHVSTVKRLRQSKESSVAVDCRDAGCDAIVIEIMLHLPALRPVVGPPARMECRGKDFV